MMCLPIPTTLSKILCTCKSCKLWGNAFSLTKIMRVVMNFGLYLYPTLYVCMSLFCYSMPLLCRWPSWDLHVWKHMMSKNVKKKKKLHPAGDRQKKVAGFPLLFQYTLTLQSRFTQYTEYRRAGGKILKFPHGDSLVKLTLCVPQ